VLAALSDLIEIQRIDAKIFSLEKERAVYPKRLDELTQKMNVFLKDIEQQTKIIADKKKEVTSLETTLQLESNKVKKWEARLAELKQQRDFVTLSREIESQKKTNIDAQEKLSALLTELRAIQTKLEEIKDNHAEFEIDFDTEKKHIETKLAEYDLRIQEHQKEKVEFLGQIPAPLLKRYDQIKQKRMGIGLAAVETGRCTACHISLPPQLYIIVQRAQTIESCPSCHRIIYFRNTVSNTDSSASST